MSREKKPGFAARMSAAWRMAAGSGTFPEREDVPQAEVVEETDINAKISGMRLDLEARDQEIATLRKEYDMLQSQMEADDSQAGRKTLEELLKGLTPLLSQLATLRTMFENSDGGITVSDFLKLLDKITKVLQAAGLEPIGRVGEEPTFDSRIHQRMSGGWLQEDDVVRVRFVGYGFKGTVLKKAMVSKRDNHENGA